MVWMLGLGPCWPRTTIRTVPQAVYRSYCPVLYRKVLISAHFPLRGSEPEQASQCRRLGICAYKLHREARGDYTNNISRVYSIIPTAIGPGGGYKTVTISPWNPHTSLVPILGLTKRICTKQAKCLHSTVGLRQKRHPHLHYTDTLCPNACPAYFVINLWSSGPLLALIWSIWLSSIVNRFPC